MRAHPDAGPDQLSLLYHKFKIILKTLGFSLWFRLPVHPGPEYRNGDAKDDVDGADVVGEPQEPHDQVQPRLRLPIVLLLCLFLFIFTGVLAP